MIIRLAGLLVQDERLDVRVVAQGVAVDMMRTVGMDPLVVNAPALSSARSEGRYLLFEEVSRLLERVRPDAILTALSGPGMGVDEALVHLAVGLPVFSLQDYEGWVVEGFGRPAPDYLVANEIAAGLTRRHPRISAHVVGDLRYPDCSQLEVMQMRETGRSGIADGRSLITFYGQPAWGFAGYVETLGFLAQAAAATAGVRFLYRPHPIETEAEQVRLYNMFEAAGGRLERCPAETIEHSLAMTDLALSVFSLIGNDHVNLQSRARGAIGTAAYLLCHKAIRDLLIADTGMDRPVVVAEGLVDHALSADEIPGVLRRGLAPDASVRSWERVQHGVRSADQTAAVIADLMLSAISTRGQARPIEA